MAAIFRHALRCTVAKLDRYYLHDDVPLSKPAHMLAYLCEAVNHPGKNVLELGSREVTGRSLARQLFARARYVGFDYYPGANVSVVGDAHKLSEYFEEQFDLIYSSAVFEHLAMPWTVAAEIAKLLKPGGLVYVETHFSFSSHERPWHFFQFSDMGLRALFPSRMGFECVEAGMSNPIVGRFSSLADAELMCKRVTGLYCHSHFLGRKIRDVPDFDWKNVRLEESFAGTRYPPPMKA